MKTILITGASSGIGRAAALHFAEQGWNVAATMRSPEQETELVHMERVLVTALDVEKPDTIRAAMTAAAGQFGRIDVLLNNAGYGAFGLFEAASEEQIKRQFEVNVFGLMRTTKAVLPYMRAQGEGLILNISSMGGILSLPTISLYHASKFAVEGFSESLYYELASQNIRVKLIEPGMVNTNFGGRSLELFSDESLTMYGPFLNRVGEGMRQFAGAEQSTPVHEVAAAIYEAASDQSDRLRYVVGRDAVQMIERRSEMGSEAFVASIQGMFNPSPVKS